MRESKDTYRNLFRTSPDAILVMDAESRGFLEINDAAQELYGYTLQEFLNLTHSPSPRNRQILIPLFGK